MASSQFFFLRALRICSPNFVNVKFEHIKKSFSKLQYSVSFIHWAKSKAINIHKRWSYNNNKNNIRSTNINLIKRHIVLPTNSTTTLIKRNLNYWGIKTATCVTKAIKRILKEFVFLELFNSKNTNSLCDAGVY